jgi:hypothetical protein
LSKNGIPHKARKEKRLDFIVTFAYQPRGDPQHCACAVVEAIPIHDGSHINEKHTEGVS